MCILSDHYRTNSSVCLLLWGLWRYSRGFRRSAFKLLWPVPGIHYGPFTRQSPTKYSFCMTTKSMPLRISPVLCDAAHWVFCLYTLHSNNSIIASVLGTLYIHYSRQSILCSKDTSYPVYVWCTLSEETTYSTVSFELSLYNWIAGLDDDVQWNELFLLRV